MSIYSELLVCCCSLRITAVNVISLCSQTPFLQCFNNSPCLSCFNNSSLLNLEGESDIVSCSELFYTRIQCSSRERKCFTGRVSLALPRFLWFNMFVLIIILNKMAKNFLHLNTFINQKKNTTFSSTFTFTVGKMNFRQPKSQVIVFPWRSHLDLNNCLQPI